MDDAGKLIESVKRAFLLIIREIDVDRVSWAVLPQRTAGSAVFQASARFSHLYRTCWCTLLRSQPKQEKDPLMFQKIRIVAATSAFLLLSVAAYAEPVSIVYSCELKEGSSKEDAMEINARWLKWARATAGSDDITSSFVSAVIGELGGFMWVDTYPDLATWATIVDADSDFDAEFDEIMLCSSNRMYRGEETMPAR
jgi:hypothetical protein